VTLGLGEAGPGLFQVILQLATALLLVLDGLLYTRHFRAQGVIPGLHPVEFVGAVRVLDPVLLDSGVHLLVIGVHRLQLDLQLADSLARGADFGIQLLPLKGQQLRLQFPLLVLVLAVFLRRLGLALQVLQLALQFLSQVGESLEVFQGAAHAALGFLATLLVLGDARGLLDKDPQLLRLGLDQPGDHALLDDGITAGTEAGAQENVCNVATPAAGTVEKIFRLALAGHLALDGNLSVAGILPADTAIRVVEHQFD
jgi:hypothetical protein